MSVALTGCGSSFVTPASFDSSQSPYIDGQPFAGTAMGGQQPIGRSRLYLFAADTSAYGHASKSLIKAFSSGQYPSQLDTNGNYYITTSYPSGSFTFSAGQYACSVGQEIYLYLAGGDVGNGANSAISEMAILGTCNSSGLFSQLTGSYVYMNEVSTVAAAYALAGFATDATHISSGPSALAGTGLLNAFNAGPNIYNINAGAAQGALLATPHGNGTVPQMEINSIADMLASCINSSGASSTNCTTLLSNALSGGTSGTTPTETATAAINIAHNPGANVANLFSLFTNTSPFQPTLSSAPQDYALIITFADGAGPTGLAIDASGNIWVTNNTASTVTKLANNGAILSGANGFSDPSMFNPDGIAIDASGNAWVSDDDDALIQISPDGTSTTSTFAPDISALVVPGIAIQSNGTIWVTQQGGVGAVLFSPGPSFTPPTEIMVTSGGGLRSPFGANSMAFDSSDDAFIVNYKASTGFSSVSKFSSSGAAISAAPGYGSTLSQHTGEGIAMDSSNRFWMTNQKEASVTIGTNTGTTTLAPGSTAAGVLTPQGIAIDGSGRAWIANTGGTISVLSSTGAAITGSHGYTGTTFNTGNGYAMSGIGAIAVDGSGNVWVADHSNSNIYEVLGGATPIVTPAVAGLSSPYTPASRP